MEQPRRGRRRAQPTDDQKRREPAPSEARGRQGVRISSVRSSALPSKYLSSASWKTSSSSAASRNSVIDDRNFIASTDPKMSGAERFGTLFTSAGHWTRRAPTTGSARDAAD